MTADILEQRIESLELKLMEVENTVQELNEVILTQYRDIERLQAQQIQLMNRMVNNNEQAATPSASDELPPHY
ncbi:MAG: SlyX family protein [Granulosicoccus sp.]